ncbi:11688_t:CDS:1, partial [Racocetra fulgida]
EESKMSLSEETQNLPEGNEEGVQSQENSTIECNRLRLTDLRVMCNKCNILMDSNKAELIARLEDLWSEPEKDFNLQKPAKGKSVEWNPAEDYDEERPRPSDEVIEQSYDFLTHMENRLEQKLEEKLGNSLSRVLDNSLQQWSAQLNNASWIGAAESNFLKK